MKLYLMLLLLFNTNYVNGGSRKLPVKKYETRVSSKYTNPNYIRDRLRGIIYKPFFNVTWENRFKKPFTPAWMDYCDPYHCNAYNKIACGLNRKTMRFKWFRSGCHIILNNMCSNYRGSLKYDMIEQRHCVRYVMLLRMGCPSTCVGEELNPLCAVSGVDNHVVLFKNSCAMDIVNCRQGILEEYEGVAMDVCAHYL